MKKILVVVDMQKDFIDGALGSAAAQSIVPRAAEKIRQWNGDLIYTLDTHDEHYLETNEGQHLPIPHCVEGQEGHLLHPEIAAALGNRGISVKKGSFGSPVLMQLLKEGQYDSVEFIGLCTDICVVSNAIMAKAFLPESQITVDVSCCAGVTEESHQAAILTMKMCQIDLAGM